MVAIETTVVLNTFSKTNIFVTIFFIRVKICYYTIFVVAMVTKSLFFFVEFDISMFYSALHCVLINISIRNFIFLYMAWEMALCHLVSLPLKGTLCHLVSCGGTKWQNDAKW